MDRRDFEKTLASYCAPTLLGQKAASLLSLSPRDYPKLAALTGEYNALVRGVRFLALGRCGERSLLLVYRPELLEAALRHHLAREMLTRAGYPAEGPLPWMFRRLMDRLAQGGEFPHEVGLFLGYPPEDVESFLRDPGGCRLCGVWKVYHDVEGARRTFRRYDRCRAWLLRRLEEGADLVSVLGSRAA